VGPKTAYSGAADELRANKATVIATAAVKTIAKYRDRM
jgi:hypothetical protein